MDGLLRQYQETRRRAQAESRRGQRQAQTNQEVRNAFEAVAGFTPRGGQATLGSPLSDDAYDEWALTLLELQRVLVRTGCWERLQGLPTGEDPARQYALGLVQQGGQKAGLDRLVALLRQALAEPTFWVEVRGHLRRLPDELTRDRPLTPATAQVTDIQEVPCELASEQPLEEEVGASPSSRRAPRLACWALGQESGAVWHAFRKVGDEWRHRGRLKNLPAGRQSELLVALAENGGFLPKERAIRLVSHTYSASDVDRIMGIVKPALSGLRTVIRDTVGVQGRSVDPLPWDQQRQGWVAAIEVGYAITEDRTAIGGEKRLRFRTREQLDLNEALDR